MVESTTLQKSSKNFVIFAAICCLLSSVTTLGIHWFFSYPEMSFDERLKLYESIKYITNRWWVIFHCLFVVIAMWGIVVLNFKKSKGFLGIGFLFFAVFSITEILRQMLVLFYLNGLREKYLNINDEILQASIRASMENFGLINNTLFALFILAFGLGNLFYGIALSKGKNFDRVLGILFLIWAFINFIAFLNDYWLSESLYAIIDFLSITFQPFMRILIGIWLLYSIGCLTLKKL